jgi:hypothetical protein
MMKQNILVFKTNIKQKEDTGKIAKALAIDSISQWTVDVNDIDCVLRVVTQTLSTNEIITIITHEGYECSELNN